MAAKILFNSSQSLINELAIFTSKKSVSRSNLSQ
ncbi:MAG: hypothetical protein ACI9JY_000973 [Saprospiraceae bacterium]|jgi:hypothetical protein